MLPNNPDSPHNSPRSVPAPDIKYAGYENLRYDCETVLTIPVVQSEPLTQESILSRPEIQNIPFLTEDEAKDALTDFVNSKCCYGKSPIKEMQFTDLQSSKTLRYILQTFTEARSTAWVSKPYLGETLMNNGMPPPQPWAIPVSPSVMFQNEIVKIEVPNTAVVKRCDKCSGTGTCKCYDCIGTGHMRCSFCHGTGGRSGQSCASCAGSGRKICWTCRGTRRICCSLCEGRCNLKWFIQATVQFKNIMEDFFKEPEDLPDQLLRNCRSECTFTEQGNTIQPINHHPDPDINRASLNLVRSHQGKYSDKRILQQRHEVFVIPVTRCSYTFKEKPCVFHVYGIDRKVYSPDYPHNCCFCCSIL